LFFRKVFCIGFWNKKFGDRQKNLEKDYFDREDEEKLIRDEKFAGDRIEKQEPRKYSSELPKAGSRKNSKDPKSFSGVYNPPEVRDFVKEEKKVLVGSDSDPRL